MLSSSISESSRRVLSSDKLKGIVMFPSWCLICKTAVCPGCERLFWAPIAWCAGGWGLDVLSWPTGPLSSCAPWRSVGSVSRWEWDEILGVEGPRFIPSLVVVLGPSAAGLVELQE